MAGKFDSRRRETIIHPIEIPDNAALRTTNAYLIDHAEGLYLVDSGWDDERSWGTFLQVMQRLHYSAEDLSGVILTHHHPDHVGYVHRVQKLNPNVRVYAHPLAVPYVKHDDAFLAQRIAFFERLYREMDGMPEAAAQIEKFKSSFVTSRAYRIEGDIELLQEGSVILDYQVMEVPGHAPDHIMLYDAERKRAIVGDLVIEHMSTNAIIEPDAEGRLIPTVTQQLASLHRLLSLDAGMLYTGHGGIIDDPGAVTRSKIARIEQKLERIMNYLREGYSTAGSIARLYDKTVLENQYFLVMSEVIGMLDHLERAGRAASRKIGGIYHYAVTKE